MKKSVNETTGAKEWAESRTDAAHENAHGSAAAKGGAEGAPQEAAALHSGTNGTPRGAAAERNETNGEPHKPYVQPFWVDLMTIVGVYVVVMVICWLVAYLIPDAHRSLTVFITTLIQFSVTIIAALWLLRRRGMKRPIVTFSMKGADPKLIPWGLLLVVATSIVIEPLLGLFPAANMQGFYDYISTGGALAMFTSVIMAPVFEEVFFRGIIQESSTREYGALGGIMIASVMFGLAHGNPQQMLNAFFCGLVLGYIYLRTKSLIPVIIIHTLNNALAYILIVVFNDRPGGMLRDMISGDFWYWLIYAVSAAIFVTACVNLWRTLSRSPAQKGAK